jgi:hypothetical protein
MTSGVTVVHPRLRIKGGKRTDYFAVVTIGGAFAIRETSSAIARIGWPDFETSTADFADIVGHGAPLLGR